MCEAYTKDGTLIGSTPLTIEKEYTIILNELRKYNPQLLDKKRILAITKSDLLDEELISEMEDYLPIGIQSVFISSIANQGINKLKDLIWKSLNE